MKEYRKKRNPFATRLTDIKFKVVSTFMVFIICSSCSPSNNNSKNLNQTVNDQNSQKKSINTVVKTRVSGAKQLTPEMVSQIAQDITVRIEGSSSSGSGVVIGKQGREYIVITAWHVLKSQNPEEELWITTPDGVKRQSITNSINRIKDVDLAEVRFKSDGTYETAYIENASSLTSGSNIFVAGYPLPSDGLISKKVLFSSGNVIYISDEADDNGYQLSYNNTTLPGMSGSPVFNSRGSVVAIHGRGLLDKQQTAAEGVFVKSGINQAVPISFYQQVDSNIDSKISYEDQEANRYLAKSYKLNQFIDQSYKDMSHSTRNQMRLDALSFINKSLSYKVTPQALLAKAEHLGSINSSDHSHKLILDLYSKAIELRPDYAEAYVGRARFKWEGLNHFGDRGSEKFVDREKAIFSDLQKAISINPLLMQAYIAMASYWSFEITDASIFNRSEDLVKFISNFNQVFESAIKVNPLEARLYELRAGLWRYYPDYDKARDKHLRFWLLDLNKAIQLNPLNARSYKDRAYVWNRIGEHQKAVNDFKIFLDMDENKVSSRSMATLAEYQVGAGQNRDALINFQRSIELVALGSSGFESETRHVLGDLGDLYMKIGDKAKACFTWSYISFRSQYAVHQIDERFLDNHQEWCTLFYLRDTFPAGFIYFLFNDKSWGRSLQEVFALME